MEREPMLRRLAMFCFRWVPEHVLSETAPMGVGVVALID
jgi:hypothetical protein